MASVWLLSIISISKIVKVILWQVLVIGRCTKARNSDFLLF